MGRPADGEANGLHAALFRAGAPLLLIPQTTPVSLGRHVAVAWKPGRAARHAVLAALPWLLRAERVQVLIAAEDGVAASPPASLLARLTKARVPAELRRFALSRPVGEALLAEAHRIGADLLVMGAYGRGRMTELLLGGATADLLRAADLPILMRH
ncbi:MAG TPA: universal stress protein [Acetobacteraceae bacterium]|nr:universal stress protein [Acetobacteraceae bacterium]